MIGTHKEWMLLRNLKDGIDLVKYNSASAAQRIIMCQVSSEIEKILQTFELSEESFLNHGEEPNNGA